ncbi:hypothetical protein [Gilliamella sp. BG6]|uniref:hypothetical protein n=1 Tax=unclassified Gilliamella TaxID=2685620 RepID=UPI003985C491
MLNSNERLEQICDEVFLKDLGGNPFNQKWIKSNCDNYVKSILFHTRIKGVKITARFQLKNKDRAIAWLIIGDSDIDKQNCISSNEITFSIWKKGKYSKEFLKRLGIDNLSEYVEKILSIRASKESLANELAYKENILKRFINFNKMCQEQGHFSYWSDDYKVDIKNIHHKNASLTITADVDFIIKICAHIGGLIKN